MQKVTIEQLNRLVAETREPMPNKPPQSAVDNAEWFWCMDMGDWQPRHDYSASDDAAMVLFDELPEPRMWRCQSGKFWVSYLCVEEDMNIVYFDTRRRVAICLAWLAWRGVNVEVIE